jgi:hypothetical protein
MNEFLHSIARIEVPCYIGAELSMEELQSYYIYVQVTIRSGALQQLVV